MSDPVPVAVALLGLLIFALGVLVPGAIEALPLLGAGLKTAVALARWPALAAPTGKSGMMADRDNDPDVCLLGPRRE